MALQTLYQITPDMGMVFKGNDNKADFCQYFEWFSDEGQGGMCPCVEVVYICTSHSQSEHDKMGL
jgi:hypothetical protein